MVPTDVTSGEAVAAMVERAVQEFGSVDILYHCAVDVHFVNHQDTRLTEMDDAVWQRMIDLVLTGHVPRLQARRPADDQRSAAARSSSPPPPMR